MTVQPSTSFWINLKDGFLEKTNYRIIESNFKNLVFGDLDQCVRGPRRIWNDQIASSNCGGTGNEKRVSSYWVEKGRIKQVNFFPLTPPPPKKKSQQNLYIYILLSFGLSKCFPLLVWLIKNGGQGYLNIRKHFSFFLNTEKYK